MRNNNKGITLLELIVTFAIVAVLALVVVPNFTQYIGYSSKGVCEANRLEFMRAYQVYLASGEGSQTLAQAMNGEVPGLAGDRGRLKCPDGGTFSVVNGSIVCSVHGAIGSSGGGSGGTGDSGGGTGGAGGDTELQAGDVIFGTSATHEVVLDSWTGECSSVTTYCKDNPYESGLKLASLLKGSVVVHNGKTYVVKWDTPWLTEQEAIDFEDNPSAVSFLKEFYPTHVITSSAHNSSNEWSPRLMNGDVFYEGGVAYVYMGSDNTQWESLPQHGGNWIRLV
ncbi:MAG: prepilin-type N-terminal cleavage/methylation domain-containing protein [Oscillospiraceae bacterium]|nr:prepilin-type N-terminal cleavage/methylation domain-containing protein [Oscillospiraceae bacterium]